MNIRQKAADRQKRLQQAMFPLMGDDRFHAFMDLLEDMKNEAVGYYVDNDSIKCDRLSLAARGEVRAYLNILAVRDSFREQIEQREEMREESQSREAVGED